MSLRFCLTVLLMAAACLPASALTMIGRVVDDEENAVADASVWLSQDRRVQTVRTGEDGTYRFDGVRVGPVELTALKAGLALGGRTAFAAGDTNLTLRLGAPGSISLRVLDWDAKPIPGARVRSLAVGGLFAAPVEALVPEGFPPLRSDDDGFIHIDFIPEGGYMQAVIEHTDYVASPLVFLPDRDKTTDVVMHAGLRLRGRVLYEDAPMPDTRVLIFQNTPQGQKKVAEDLTDGDGLFRFVVDPGLYFVALRHPDYASPPPAQAGVYPATAEEVPVFSLLTPCVITGRVVQPDGQGRGGVRVAYREERVVYEDIFTDTDGNYLLKVPGNADGFLTIDPPLGFMTEYDEELPLKIGEQRYIRVQDIPLAPLPSLAGTVRVDEEPASGVLVTAFNLTRPCLTITGGDGRFSLPLSDVPKGKIVLLRAEHAHRFLRKNFAIHLDQPNPVEVTLESFDPDQAQEPNTRYRNDLASLLNEPAPDIACRQWWNSEPVQLIDLRGKVVVLTMWAGFDQTPLGFSVLQEMRALHDLYAEADDVVIVGVHDCTSSPDEVEDFVNTLAITFPVGLDEEPLVTFDRYGVNVIPQTFLIDKEGVLRYYQTDGRLLELVKVLRRR